MWAIIIFLSIGLFNMFQDPKKISSNNNKIYKFKTLPGSNDNTGFSFMTGGDSGTTVQFQDVLSASSRRLNMLGKEIEFSFAK